LSLSPKRPFSGHSGQHIVLLYKNPKIPKKPAKNYDLKNYVNVKMFTGKARLWTEKKAFQGFSSLFSYLSGPIAQIFWGQANLI
jgi:hypothetical protein